MKAKRFLIVLLSLILVFGCFVSAEASSTPKISKTSAKLTVGSTVQLKVTGTGKKVTWKSSNKKVAIVSSSGKVTGKGKGTAVITAKVGTKTLKCTVKVYRYYIPSNNSQMDPWSLAGEYRSGSGKKYEVNFYTESADFSTGVVYINSNYTYHYGFTKTGTNVYRVNGTANYFVFQRSGSKTVLKHYKNGKLIYTGTKYKSYMAA